MTTNAGMNYAEDRLDRRVRNNGRLWIDFQFGITRLPSSHSFLANTLRDTGWIRHATFHYGQAWIANPTSQRAAGDYAQMAELAGFAPVGVIALFHVTSGGSLRKEKVSISSQAIRRIPSDWLDHPTREGHCGCGVQECGQSLCYIPMINYESTLQAIETYISLLSSRCVTMPTTHEVLSTLAKQATLSCSDDVPIALQYWNQSDDITQFLEPVLQLLMTKLLYLTLPHIAAEGVAQLHFDDPIQLAADFKSHWAYYLLIQAVVLGERIKPHRRRTLEWYHVPVWDILWGKDQRRNQTEHVYHPSSLSMNTQHIRSILQVCQGYTNHTLIWTGTLDATTPLYVVGDSHVLSMAWQTIVLPSSGKLRLLIPIVVTGLKAWHTRSETRFFTHALLHTLLQRINCHTIVISAGEIDCREGIGGEALEGYNHICQDHITRTVREYVDALNTLSKQYRLQILVLPVAPHAHKSDKYGKAVGRATRRQVMQRWNHDLQRTIEASENQQVHLLDYERALLDSGYVLKPAYNADSTHMNSAFLPHLEEALKTCGLDDSLL